MRFLSAYPLLGEPGSLIRAATEDNVRAIVSRTACWEPRDDFANGVNPEPATPAELFGWEWSNTRRARG